jgi:hypothetical protein
MQQYFEANNLSIDTIKTCYILFQMKQCRQESEIKILIKNNKIVNVKSTSNVKGWHVTLRIPAIVDFAQHPEF